MENLIMPVGAIDKIRVTKDTDIVYSYLIYDVIGEVHEGEEYFVYKEIDGWCLIGNNQWINSKAVESRRNAITTNVVKEPVVNEPILITGKLTTSKEEEIHADKVIEKESETVEDIETVEEIANVEKVEREKPTLFKKIKKIFGK